MLGIHITLLQNVHHAGQPMPGEEQEEIVMTSTQSNLLNVTCPLSGKPVTELADPVRRYPMDSVPSSFFLFLFCLTESETQFISCYHMQAIHTYLNSEDRL